MTVRVVAVATVATGPISATTESRLAKSMEEPAYQIFEHKKPTFLVVTGRERKKW
ncbi:hypothetical protein KDAU_34510 [Dictyobacter aurantiacus]|uniref:Uncharacterized protein n=1 Tax=Dictyobacter aurantiacus TaxID=1936993 RepID=A0A401ZGZ9_9CHLR|nr:hypothetical protein KDAU_34510 [Dictyobacter aurantiacus]